MKEKLPGRTYIQLAAQEDEREKSGRGCRRCHVDDTEAARKMKEKLPSRRYKSWKEDEREKSRRGYRSCQENERKAAR
jgi:hypothetical protein